MCIRDRAYSVPYMWGTVCIAYDPEQVTEEVNSWDILWDEDYARRIFMIDSERDSIGVALLSLGYSLNSTDPDELEEAKQKLLEQKPLVLAYTCLLYTSTALCGKNSRNSLQSWAASVLLWASTRVGRPTFSMMFAMV